MNDKEKVAKMVGILMMSRTYSHMAHLNTPSYAKHIALNDFYDALVGHTDIIAEASQGLWGKLDIPYVELKGDVSSPVKSLKSHLMMLENLAKGCEHRALNAIFDDIIILYLSTIYKLQELD